MIDSAHDAMAKEVAQILGWEKPPEYGDPYRLPHAPTMTHAELSTLHRVLTEGKRAREALERISIAGAGRPSAPLDNTDAATNGHDWGWFHAAEIARAALSGGSSYGS